MRNEMRAGSGYIHCRYFVAGLHDECAFDESHGTEPASLSEIIAAGLDANTN